MSRRYDNIIFLNNNEFMHNNNLHTIVNLLLGLAKPNLETMNIFANSNFRFLSKNIN